jgi:hypothetical protein
MSTSAILALVRIIRNKDYVMGKRLEACETLLEYETRSEVVKFARDFLEDVYTCEEPYDWENPRSIGVDHKLWALRLTRKLEARKVRQETVTHRSPHVIDMAEALRTARVAHQKRSGGDSE